MRVLPALPRVPARRLTESLQTAGSKHSKRVCCSSSSSSSKRAPYVCKPVCGLSGIKKKNMKQKQKYKCSWSLGLAFSLL